MFRRGGPSDWPPVETVGAECLLSSLVDIPPVVTRPCWGVKGILRDSAGRGSGTLAPDSRDFLPRAFSLC